MIEPSQCRNIGEVRAEIDELDQRIIALIGRRYDYVKAIARFKKTEADVHAGDRLREVLNTRREWATAAGLDEELIENLYRTMIDHFIRKELELLAIDASGRDSL